MMISIILCFVVAFQFTYFKNKIDNIKKDVEDLKNKKVEAPKVVNQQPQFIRDTFSILYGKL